MTFTRQSKQIRQNLHHKPQVSQVLWRMMICLYEGNWLPYSSDFFGCFLFASDHFEHFGHLPTKGLVPEPTKASAIIAWGSSLYTGCDGNGTLSSCTPGNHGKNDGFFITPSLLPPYVYVGKVRTARDLVVVAKSVLFFYKRGGVQAAGSLIFLMLFNDSRRPLKSHGSIKTSESCPGPGRPAGLRNKE